MSMGGLGDSFYEYLLKAWIQSGKQDSEAREMFDEAMKAVLKHMLQTSPGGLMYISDLKYEKLEHKMDALACFSGTQRFNLCVSFMSLASSVHLYVTRFLFC